MFVAVIAAIEATRGQPGLTACVPGGGKDHFPFCNTSLPIDERVWDLVARIPDSIKPNLLTARGCDGPCLLVRSDTFVNTARLSARLYAA